MKQSEKPYAERVSTQGGGGTSKPYVERVLTH